MADHRAPGRATTGTRAPSSAPRNPGAFAAEPPTEGSAADRASAVAAAPSPPAPRVVGVAAAAPGLRVLLAAIVAAVLAAAAVVVEGAATGSTQAATGPAAQSAGSSAAPSSATPSPTSLASAHVPLSARTDPAAVAELASSRRRAVSRDSARRVQAARADRELERTAEAKADARRVALAEIDASAERRSEEIARNTWVRPIASGYRLTATFGQCSGLWSSCHTGLDLAVPSGTPIHSVAAGRVTETGYDGAYGNKTVVTLDDGTELWYCHQTSVEVSVGDTVAPGQQIGTVGSTGNTTGPHLHLEVHPGAGDDAVDPAAALAEHGVAL